jgi:hypothetical protein
MSLRDNELARRQDGRIELRPRPLRVRWNLSDLLAADGHELRATFACSVRALPDATERRMLEEVLLGARYALSDEDVARHFEGAIRTAASKSAQKHPASDWLANGSTSEMTEAIRSAAVAIAFDCGIELLPPFNLDLQSPTYQQQQLRAMQQALAEKHTAGQIEHVQRAGELLKQFHTIRDATPELSPGRVLEQISPADRGAVLQTLLLASAKQQSAARVWAVAGPYLVNISLESGSPVSRLDPLPPALGPLRSVQPADIDGTRRLLVGARNGFMVVDPEKPADAELFTDEPNASLLGFNRVMFWGQRQGFVASHGDAGIVRWERGHPGAPASELRLEKLGLRPVIAAGGSDAASASGGGPRNLQALCDSSLVFSVGGKLYVTNLQDVQALQTLTSAEIVAILPDDRRLIVVHEDGTICALERNSQQVSCILRRSNRIRSAGALPWLGSSRLLLADDQGPIECIGFDDQLVTQYQSPHRSLRAVAGSTDVIVAISSDRQRLIVWRTWDGRQPLTEIYLTGLTRHRIADIDFG